jgi:putative transposase
VVVVAVAVAVAEAVAVAVADHVHRPSGTPPGFPEAIEATWPLATVQTCAVHLIRSSMRFISYGHRKAAAAARRSAPQPASGPSRARQPPHRPSPDTGWAPAGATRTHRARRLIPHAPSG